MPVPQDGATFSGVKVPGSIAAYSVFMCFLILWAHIRWWRRCLLNDRIMHWSDHQIKEDSNEKGKTYSRLSLVEDGAD